MAPRKRPQSAPMPELPVFGSEHVERLGRTAQRWEWRARSGDSRARTTAQILTAVTWALRQNDAAALTRMAKAATAYLETLGPWALPFARDAGSAYEQIMTTIENYALPRAQGENAKRQAAAQWFIMKARLLGFELPGAPRDDAAATALCVQALEDWHRKTFADDQERAESWTRAMAEACGCKNPANAAKGRWKTRKRPSK